MNRQFKFQAKLLKSESWIYGYYIKQNGKHYIIDNFGTFWQIRIETLCDLITKIGDKEIYEYNCYIDVENKPHIFTYFFYNKLGILEVRSYNLSRDNNKEDIGSINYALREQLESLLEMTFVGNLKDGIEYIREQISKSLEVKCQ